MDPRTYIRLHDGMPDHPKVVGLSDAAFRLYVEAMCWCGRQLTDGKVGTPAMRRMGGWSPEATDELVKARLLEAADGETWTIHDYTEHQRTSAEVAVMRESKRLAGVTGNHERWHVSRGVVDPSCEFCCIPTASHLRSVKDPSAIPLCDPKASQYTETDTEEEKKQKNLIGTDADQDFTAFWAAYPRKIGKGAARKAYRSAVIGKRTDPKKITLAGEAFRDECKRLGTEMKFIPHPATWLNAERYDDEAHEASGATGYSYSPWEN